MKPRRTELNVASFTGRLYGSIKSSYLSLNPPTRAVNPYFYYEAEISVKSVVAIP